MKESDLYPPLKKFLEVQGYEVKGEVQNCDVVAVRNDESPVVVELKLSLNLDVVLQSVERLSLTSKVYIGVPDTVQVLKRRQRQLFKMLKMLGLGLMVIGVKQDKQKVEILLDPVPYAPRKSKPRKDRLLGEFASRVGDPNAGGSATTTGRMTAYRQKSLAIAKFLSDQGPSKASNVAKVIDEPKTRDILYRNVYGWFERVSLGVYTLSPRGKREFPLYR